MFADIASGIHHRDNIVVDSGHTSRATASEVIADKTPSNAVNLKVGLELHTGLSSLLLNDNRRPRVIKKCKLVIGARVPLDGSSTNDLKANYDDSYSYDDSNRRDVFHLTSVRDIGLCIPGRDGTILSGTFGGIFWSIHAEISFGIT